MHQRIDPSDRLLSLASAQKGVLSARQVTSMGLPLRCVERLITQGHWTRLTDGLYYVESGNPEWLGMAWGGLLLGGSRARLGFAAAGYLWQLIPEEPRTITVLVPYGNAIVNRGPWEFRRELPTARDQRSPGNPSRTTIEETVIDLCSEVEQARVLDLVTRAVQSRRTTAARILAQVDDRNRVRHRQYLRDILGDVAEGAQSALELRYLHDVERANGLPRATRQARARGGKAFRDVRYDEYSTIVELDGQVHVTEKLRDTRRDNAALLDGDVTLRYGWDDVAHRPCMVAAEVAAILRAQGWPGMATSCPHCLAWHQVAG